MKSLTVFAFSLVVFAVPAFADTVLLNPDLTGGSAPSGFTETDANGAAITYTGTGTSSGDASVDGAQAYLTGTTTANLGWYKYDTQLTVTSTYTATSGRTYSDFNLLRLDTTSAANNALLSIDLISSGYNNDTQLWIGQGIGFGGGAQSGTNVLYLPGGINSLSGTAVTFNIYTTLTDLGPDSSNAGQNTWQINNTGTAYADGTLLGTFNLTAVGDAASPSGLGNGYDPGINPLKLSFGLVGSGNGGDGFLTPPASVDISSVTISAVPEPSSYAMLALGLGVLVFAANRRKSRAA